jgi:hypothetical protein
MKYIDLTNQTFGLLTAIKIDTTKHNRIFWICECKCGNTKSVAAKHLRSESITSCGCAKFHIGNTSRTWRGYGEIGGKYFSNIKGGAIKRNLEFSVTIENMWDVFVKQNRKCALTGETIYFRDKTNGEQTASIDRINSNMGYTIENIQWVHKDVNLMKQNLSEDTFLKICKQIVEYKKLK